MLSLNGTLHETSQNNVIKYQMNHDCFPVWKYFVRITALF